jgi:hypothetical protein
MLSIAQMPANKRATAETPATKRPGISPLGMMRKLDPPKWQRTVRKAMKAAEGRVPVAAEALGVNTRTLFLWLEDEALADVARAPMGPPRKSV